MIQKELIRIAVSDLVPYERNPRKIPQEAIDDVKESYRQCGAIDPIEIDENNVILSGHTRRLAAQEMGITEVDALRVTGLTEPQKKKYRLLANKTGEKSGWDYELLEWELQDLDFEGYDFGFDVKSKEKENPYTGETKIPQYEIKDEYTELDELCDFSKRNELVEEIEKSGLTAEEKNFLKAAADRHVVFDYRKIAEYYAMASEEMQEFMEKSALVIIDFDDAVANGYAKLSQKIGKMRDGV